MEKRFCIYGFLTGSPIVGGLSAIRKLSQRPVVTNGHRIGYSPSCKGRFYECFTKSALRSSQASFPSHRRHKRMWELRRDRRDPLATQVLQRAHAKPRRIKKALSP